MKYNLPCADFKQGMINAEILPEKLVLKHRLVSLSSIARPFSPRPRLPAASSEKVRTKIASMLAVFFAQASLAFGILSYPVFLQFGAHNGAQDKMPAKDQFDFCQLLRGEPAQSCGVTTRFVLREMQSGMGDRRACLQVASAGKILFHPLHAANWDRTSLMAYSSYYWRSDLILKRLKARVAQHMLDRHREIDAQCQTEVVHSLG